VTREVLRLPRKALRLWARPARRRRPRRPLRWARPYRFAQPYRFARPYRFAQVRPHCRRCSLESLRPRRNLPAVVSLPAAAVNLPTAAVNWPTAPDCRRAANARRLSWRRAACSSRPCGRACCPHHSRHRRNPGCLRVWPGCPPTPMRWAAGSRCRAVLEKPALLHSCR
jgi:hypothetical protein